MLAKIVFVLCLTALFGASLGVSPEELRFLTRDIADTITNKYVLTSYRLRKHEEAALLTLTDNARENIKRNVTALAEPYWNRIESFENDAKTRGADISDCVNDGNKRFYTLTKATLEEPIYKVSLFEEEGNDTIDSSLNQANKVLEELFSLEEKVNACSNEDCATILDAEIEQFLVNGVTALEKALKEAYEYVQVNMQARLDGIPIASSIYVHAFNAILDDIATCIEVV